MTRALDLELFDRTLRLALALGGDEPPVSLCAVHPFHVSMGSDRCGACGGGILHDVHAAAQVASS